MPHNMACTILILAAGASSRMRGGDKLLEEVAGHPLLARQARAALDTGCPVRVALPPDRPARHAALDGLDVDVVTVADANTGMAASIRAGVAGLPGAVLLLLADLPEITRDDLERVLAAQPADPDMILRGTAADGTPGHPVLFPPWAVPALARLTGDTGARDLLKAEAARTRLIALPDAHATTDLDTPEDWAAWRARQGR
ncbi:nucleotidyltransferase family protein [Fertoebacter nigrum]|uniref:Nucleotidyltransferase family protein n=1 Tax=Fertoeibacter niger TaxID=2656921 RepID=A0A8X8GUG7_9RHOB|nr:nucleotidyltransferase family protein [Fertoeibacter niger]NUB43317.1 nucleotidyltransferase family protein [Fertoeibacter niger]